MEGTDQSSKPTAFMKRTRTDKDTPIKINPKGTGDELKFSVAKDPERGTASPTKTGDNLIYTPDKGFTGDDTFTYKATDKQKVESNEATVTVTVTAIATAPLSSRFISFLRNPFPGFTDVSEVYSKDKPINDPLDGVPEMVPFLVLWRNKATTLRFLQVSLGFLAVFFSLLTTTVLQFTSSNTYNAYAKIFAFIAAVAVGLLTAFDLGTKSNNMTNAWRKLNAAVIKFNRGICYHEEVIDAYIDGENTIGNVTFQQQGESSTEGSNIKK
jgi:hypothetical protein